MPVRLFGYSTRAGGPGPKFWDAAPVRCEEADPVKTPLTQRFGLAYPIIQAPMVGGGYGLAVRPDGGKLFERWWFA